MLDFTKFSEQGYRVEDKRPEREYYTVTCEVCQGRWSLQTCTTEAREASEASLRGHAATCPALPATHTIDSVAAIKRLPIGTRLYVVRSLLGPNAPAGRVLKAVRSKDLVLTIDQPSSKNHGQDSYLQLSGVRVEPTPAGFRLVEKESGETCVEYVFQLRTS